MSAGQQVWLNVIRTTTAALFLSVAIGSGSVARAAASVLCNGIELAAPIEPELSDGEREFVCGFRDTKGTPYQAWAEIPLSQARWSLKSFLQSRAYLRPRIEFRGERLFVDPGVKTRVTDLAITGLPDGVEFPDPETSALVGEELTPSALNRLEARLRERLSESAYPCARVVSEASAETGKVAVVVDPGSRVVFGEVGTASLPGSRREILRRSYAFVPGQPYEERLLEVTDERLISSGLVERSVFVPRCSDDGTSISLFHQVFRGEPRLFSLGLAANTEEWLQGSFLWRYPGLSPNGSTAEVDAYASWRLQQASIGYRLSPLRAPNRLILLPLLTVRRQSEAPFEDLAFESELRLGTMIDTRRFGTRIGVGPVFGSYRSDPGLNGGPKRDGQGFGVSGRLELASYGRELYGLDAPDGWEASARVSAFDAGVAGDFNLIRGSLEGSFRKPAPFMRRLFLGGRGRLGITDVASSSPRQPPASFEQFAGGDRDLRGFTRLELPRNGQGAESVAVIGGEVLWENAVANLSPFGFVDAAKLGREAWNFDPALFWSPGLGVDWRSPAGRLRLYGALGQIVNDDVPGPSSQWRIFASFGGGF